MLGDPVEAEDALQDGLLDAWRRIRRFRGEATFSTWMYRIVTNRCLAALRRRRPVLLYRVDVTVPAPDTPERAAEVNAGLVELGRAVRALSDDQRGVLGAAGAGGAAAYSEIAHITGASEDAVRGGSTARGCGWWRSNAPVAMRPDDPARSDRAAGLRVATRPRCATALPPAWLRTNTSAAAPTVRPPRRRPWPERVVHRMAAEPVEPPPSVLEHGWCRRFDRRPPAASTC